MGGRKPTIFSVSYEYIIYMNLLYKEIPNYEPEKSGRT